MSSISGQTILEEKLKLLKRYADAQLTLLNSYVNTKANTTDVNAALALKANTSDVTTSLASKVNTTDYTAALALKVDRTVDGKVGIGTTTPAHPLEVIGSAKMTTIRDTLNSTGTAGQVLSSTGSALSWVEQRPTFKNVLINGDFVINQRTKPGETISHTSSTTFSNHSLNYTFDRWYILSSGDHRVNISQELADLPGEQYGYMQTALKMTVSSLSGNKKFGIAQIVEQRNLVGLIGKPVTLSFKMKVSSTTKLDNIKAAIVQWTGAADIPPRNIIDNWNVEGVNPTLVTNASYVNTPQNINCNTSWIAYSGTNAEPITGTVSANAKNVIVFIWSDVTDTTENDFILLTDVQLEAGSVATLYDRIPIDVQLQRCLRYTYGLWQTQANAPFGVGICTASTKFDTIIHFPVTMRTTPTATFSAGSTFRIYVTVAYVGSAIATAAISRNLLHMQATGSGLPTGSSGLFQDAGPTALSYVIISAEFMN